MRFGGTLVFASVVAAVGGFALYDYKSQQKESELKTEASKVFGIDANAVRSVRIQRGSDPIELVKENGSWRVQSPVADLADVAAVDAYVTALLNETARELKLPDPAKLNWGDYFLDSPGAQISIKLDSGDERVVQVSRTAAFDGSYFLRRGDVLLLGASAWASHTEKAATHFRDKTVFRSKGKATEIRRASGKEKLRLKRENDSWSLDGMSWVVDVSKVESLISDLQALQATDFAAESKSPEALKKYKLDKPEFSFAVVLEQEGGAQSTWELAVSPEIDGFRMLSTSDSQALFKVSSSTLTGLRREAQGFRDAKEPFRVAMEQVQELWLKQGSTEVGVRKEGVDWKLAAGPTDRVLNEEGLKGLLSTLGSLEADEFLGAQAGRGLSKPKTEVLLKGGDGQLLLDLKVGDGFEAKGEKFVYVKSQRVPDTLGVREARWADVKLESLLKEKSSQ